MTEWDIELVGAVIAQTIRDLSLPDSTEKNIHNRKTAESFLAGRGLEAYCKICGLDVSYIRRHAEKNKKSGVTHKACE